MNNLSNQIQSLAQAKKIENADLASRAGLAELNILQIYSGDYSCLTDSNLNKLADALDGDIDSFRKLKKMDDEEKAQDTGGQKYELKNIEIFRTGTWNGNKFTDADLNEIVKSFPRQGFNVPVKLGHKESSGLKAFGWVRNLRKAGDKLIADFVDLPKPIFDAIKNHQYDSVSSEIFSNLRRGSDFFKRALKAVALLGAEIPAVAGLKPLRESLNFSDYSYDQEFAFELKKEDIEMDITELQNQLTNALAEIDKLKESGADSATVTALKNQIDKQKETIDALAKKNREGEIDVICNSCNVPAYREYLAPILNSLDKADTKELKFTIGDDADLDIHNVIGKLIEKINADTALLFQYASKAGDNNLTAADNPADELDQAIKAYQEKHTDISYADAMTKVLESNEDLARRYNEHTQSN